MMILLKNINTAGSGLALGLSHADHHCNENSHSPALIHTQMVNAGYHLIVELEYYLCSAVVSVWAQLQKCNYVNYVCTLHG